MKSTLPLSALEEQLRLREASFRDLTVSARYIRMEPVRGDLLIHGQANTVQDHVHTLLGPKLGIPAAYLRRCPPLLRARNANHWLEQLGDKQLFVRFDGDSVRAVLSTRYTPVSNSELVHQLLDYLPSNGATQVKAEVSPTKMVCQVILPEQRRLMGVGDEVFGGINLVNSEVGFASVEVATFLHRLVCANGLVVRVKDSSYRRIHLKRRDRLTEEVRGAFSRAVSHVPKALTAMHRAVDVPLEDPLGTLEGLQKRHGLTQDEHDAVTIAWEAEQGPSLYHLVNSLTGAARSTRLSLDSRLRLQSLAGDLLPA